MTLRVPFGDEWSWSDLIYRLHLGNIHFADLWQQHNEHRMLFPNLIMLGLAMLGGWNQFRETLFGLFLVVVTQIGLFVLLRRIIVAVRLPYVFLAASLLLYSLAQMENWDWGFQSAWFLCNLCAVWALVFLGASGQSWFALLAAAMLTFIASFSLSQGLMIWIAGFVALLLTEKRRPAQIAVWIGCAMLAFIVYFYGYSRPVQHPDPLYGLHHPLITFRYLGAYFGAVFAGWASLAAAVTLGWIGLIATALLVCVVAIDYRSNRHHAARAAGFVGLAVYAVSVATITTVGRVGFGEAQAEASRYASISIYCWITVFALSVAYERMLRERLSANVYNLWPAVAFILLFFYVGADQAGWALGAGRLASVQSAYPALIIGHGPELTVLFPAELRVETYIKQLQAIKDGPYYE